MVSGSIPGHFAQSGEGAAYAGFSKRSEVLTRADYGDGPMTTVTVISDLHLESRPLSLDQILDADVTSDVLCLLGDIGDPLSAAYRELLAACAARFPTVLLLAGNNEYRNHDGRGRTMAQTEDLIRAAAAAHPNVHFLQNSTFVVRNLAFIGTTLWSHLPDTALPPAEGADAAAGRRAATNTATAAAAVPAAPALATDSVMVKDLAAPSHVEDALVTLSMSPAAAAKHDDADLGGSSAPGDGSSASSQLTRSLPLRSNGTAVCFTLPSPAERGPASLPVTLPPRLAPKTCGAAYTTAAPQANHKPSGVGRVMSCSQPETSLLIHLQNLSAASSSGAVCGVDARTCRRLMMRHSVSLSSLRPDEPCPPWTARDSSASASSESDARSSSDDSSASHSDGSDGEGRRSGPDSGASGGSRKDALGRGGSKSSPVPAAKASSFRDAEPPAAVSSSPRWAAAPAGHDALHPSPSPSPSRFAAAAAVEPAQAPAAEPKADAAAADAAAEPRHHPHHRRHQHHAASTDAATTEAAAAPATIREYIGATSLDYRRIFATPGGPPITPDITNAIFGASLQYLQAAVAAALDHGLVPVVLSHHAPSIRGTCRPSFAGHPSTHAYGTDLEPYLVHSGIAAWYCGHTHYNFDVELQGGMRLASNQFGSQPQPADGYSRAWQQSLPHPAAPEAYSSGAVGSPGFAVAASRPLAAGTVVRANALACV